MIIQYKICNDLSSWAHFELVTIHPWADGNGRTSRLLMNLLQMEYGVLPTKVLKQDKVEYIQALIETREEEEVNIFLDCMAQLHIAHLQHDIRQYEESIQDEADGKGGQKTEKVDRKLVKPLSHSFVITRKSPLSKWQLCLASIAVPSPSTSSVCKRKK